MGGPPGCPLCGGRSEGEALAVREMMLGTRERFSLGTCGGCGTLILLDAPGDLGRYYPDDYYSLRPAPPARAPVRLLKRLRGAAAARGQRRLARALGAGSPPIWMEWLELAGLDRSARVCDVGCGGGELLRDLEAAGFRGLVGVDPMIAGSVREGEVRLERAELAAVEGSFELITFNHSLEHVADPIDQLRSARERLAPGGTVLVRVPVAGSWAARHYGPDWVALDPPRHLFVPTPEGVAAAAAAAGLELYATRYDSTEMQFWRSEQYRRDIALFEPGSHQLDPAGSPFSASELREWRRRARALNRAADGDTAAFYCRAAGPGAGAEVGAERARVAAGRRPRILMAAPDPRDPGGITAVVASWLEAGLGGEVELAELPTAAMDSPLPRKLAQAARALARLAPALARPRRRPDLVHLHASTGGSLLRKLALSWGCRLARVPYVAQMHSGGFEPWLAASALNRAAARSLFSHAAVAIVLGERWRAPMSELGPGRIELLPNAIPEAERLRLAAVAERRPERGAEPAVLLFYGRWAPVKGVDLLAGALRGLDRADYELRVYGNGDRAWLQRQLAGLRGSVRVGGWLEGEEKLRQLARADAVLAPSRREGLPSALLEARCAGVPVIATEVGAVPEALAGYGAARLLAAEDEAGLREALEELLDGRWPPAGAGAGADELPERLRAESAVAHLVAIYRSVAGTGTDGPGG